jgi:hypothetical protein
VRAPGLPQPDPDPRKTLKVNPTGELKEPTLLIAAATMLDKVHGYEPNAVDRADLDRPFGQLKGQLTELAVEPRLPTDGFGGDTEALAADI